MSLVERAAKALKINLNNDLHLTAVICAAGGAGLLLLTLAFFATGPVALLLFIGAIATTVVVLAVARHVSRTG